MDWTQFAIFMISNIFLTLTLWLWSRAESRADHRELESWTKEMITSMQQEMKDFHGRLERQDAEFKARLCSIEERNKR